MQKGFATLEIILMTFIIAVLVSVAIPNALRMIDRAALDYETKKLYTDLRFLQSFERMTTMNDSHFTAVERDEVIIMYIYPERYVVQNNSANKIYAENFFSYDVTVDKQGGTDVWKIQFDDMGKVKPAISDSLKLTSRLKKDSYIVFDSVGRFRGSREKKSEEWTE
ncbi:MAG: type II secretion system protein [Selenomonadaceae bacterium]|nr:type II secretion system protein [Selenomonadaceae bacterium]